MNTEHLTLPERQARFSRLCERALLEAHRMGESGIGTLGEKRLHALIKRFLCEDEQYHEVGLDKTRYVSDIRVGNDITEVQTGAFYPMKNKIAYYLDHTDCTVTVVHPIVVRKWVCYIDPKSGTASERRRSPRVDRPAELLAELFSLLPSKPSSRLRFRLLCIEAQDFRLLTPKSGDTHRATKRFERIPLALLDDMIFESAEDLRMLLPTDLSEHFAVKEFSRLSKLRGRDAYSAVRAMAALGLALPAEPIGRAMAFKRNY